MSRRALITGITGQGGSYLAEYLLEQGAAPGQPRRPCPDRLPARPVGRGSCAQGRPDRGGEQLAWKPTVSFDELGQRMVDADLRELKAAAS